VSVTAVSALASPFRGLAPFGDTELDALLFFGRERETEVAVANLLAARLTLLYGPSGVGKSSLLRAGVARRIRELAARRAIGRRPDCAVVVFSAWADDPVPALAMAIAQEVTGLVRRSAASPPPGSTLADIVDHWSAVLDGDVYLVLDQLEEYFVYAQGADGPGTLLAELPEVILRPRLRASVLLSLRDDALAQLDVFKARVPNLFANVLRLDRLDRAAATAAIVGPIRRWNELVPDDRRLDIEPGLVEAVLLQASVAEEPDRIEPPFLQLVLERLLSEELARGSRVLREATLTELGGAGAIVREHLDRALAVLDEAEQDAAARMFDHLVTPSGTKVAHRASDLARFGHVPEAKADSVLAALGRERILRPLDEGSAGGRYEIFHDVLADAILGWCGRREVEGERAAVRRRHRRLVLFSVAAAAAALVMAAVAVFALSARSDARTQARSAQARALTAAALTQLATDPELALVLARQAATLRKSPQVEDVLRQALLASRVRAVARIGEPLTAAAFVAGGGTAAALGARGRVALVDAGTGQVRRVFDVQARRTLLDPTGRYVLAYGSATPARIVDVAGGGVRRLGSGPVRLAWFSADGRFVLTAGDGTQLHLWETSSGRVVRAFRASGAPTAAAVSPDDRLVAAADDAGSVEVFATAGRRIAAFPQRNVVTKLVFGPGSTLLAVVRADETVRLENVRTRALVSDYRGHVGHITDVAFDPLGTLVATASTDGTARVWQVGGGLETALLGHRQYVTSIAFSPDGRRIVTASNDRTARLWDTGGNQVAVLAGNGDAVAAASFAADGRTVVTAGADGSVRFWDAVGDPILGVVRRVGYPVPAARATGTGIVAATPGAPDVAVSADGRRWATGSGGHVVVRLSSTGAEVAALVVAQPVTGIALSPDGTRVAIGGSHGTVRIYGLDGRRQRTLEAGEARLTRVAYSHDGRMVAAGSTDGTAKVWRLASGHVQVLRGHTAAVLSARFAPGDRLLVTASVDHDARIWNLSTGATAHVLRGHFAVVSDADFSPDGRWVVTAGPGKGGLWNASTGELLFYLQGHSGKLASASFAPDDRTIVTAGADGTVRTYVCDVCAGIDGLMSLADRRLAVTGRRLSATELSSYVE
jgi:WD40 repeat protein